MRCIRILAIVCILGILFGKFVPMHALSQRQKDTADLIADICMEEWETYGRLPSVAVGQAFVESGLGSGPNIFGVKGHSGRGTVSATYGYLNCLNNQYFHGEGAFIFDREDQLSIIMKGGRYCEGQYPGGSYYRNVINSIYKYGWDKYDERLQSKIARKIKMERQRKNKAARKRHQRESFRLHPKESVEPGTCVCDPKYVKKGSVIVVNYAILECTKTKKGLGNRILVHGNSASLPMIFEPILEVPKKCKDEVYLTEVIEGAKG